MLQRAHKVLSPNDMKNEMEQKDNEHQHLLPNPK